MATAATNTPSSERLSSFRRFTLALPGGRSPRHYSGPAKLLTDALLGQIDNLRGVFLGNESRAGHQIFVCRQQDVSNVVIKHGHGQIALEVLLLIDGKIHLF